MTDLLYSISGDWLTLKGEKVLFLEGKTQTEKETIKNQYNYENQETNSVPDFLLLFDQPSISWEEIKERRNKLLYESDWTQLLDAVLTNQERLDWQLYRQELRDIPQTFSSPELVIWPEAPNG